YQSRAGYYSCHWSYHLAYRVAANRSGLVGSLFVSLVVRDLRLADGLVGPRQFSKPKVRHEYIDDDCGYRRARSSRVERRLGCRSFIRAWKSDSIANDAA